MEEDTEIYNMSEQDIQQLSIYTQSLFLFAVRHENSSDDTSQGNTFKTLPEVKYWLETIEIFI